MSTTTLKEVSRSNQLSWLEKKTALIVAQPLVAWSKERENSFLQLTDGYIAMFSDEHAAYLGAKIIIDIFTGDPRKASVDRADSYAFYNDVILYTYGLLKPDLDQTPVREVAAGEIKTLFNRVKMGKLV